MSRPGRARFASGHVRTVSHDASPKLAISDEAVVLGPAKDRLALRCLRTFIRVAVCVVLVAAAMYLALAVTVVAVMGSGAKNAIVVRGAFPGGIATQGDFAYVSAGAYDRSLMGKFQQAFMNPGGATIQIVALPGARLTTVKGQILADRKATGFYGALPAAKLGHEYLAVCVSGTGCTTGEQLVVPDDRVVGKVSRFVGLDGLTSPTSYRR
jgi:hypothetical protein